MLNREIFSNECEKHAVKFTVTRQRSARCWPRAAGGRGHKNFLFLKIHYIEKYSRSPLGCQTFIKNKSIPGGGVLAPRPAAT